MSERATYDKAKYFGGRVTDYHWPDHHGPPFSFIFRIVQQSYNWLKGKSKDLKILADPENVIIVHCNSGKGRTGTAIVAFLLFCGFFDNVDDALKFYG